MESGYNRYWGLTFKEGNENSRFGEQIEDYACVYTSRASNFVFYSPMQYFRVLRRAMPHERSALRLAPWGEEHAAPAAGTVHRRRRDSGSRRSLDRASARSIHRSAAGRPRLVPGPVFKTGEGC